MIVICSLGFWEAHHMLLLPTRQRVCCQSKPLPKFEKPGRLRQDTLALGPALSQSFGAAWTCSSDCQ